jgi:hypothetical protein
VNGPLTPTERAELLEQLLEQFRIDVERRYPGFECSRPWPRASSSYTEVYRQDRSRRDAEDPLVVALEVSGDSLIADVCFESGFVLDEGPSRRLVPGGDDTRDFVEWLGEVRVWLGCLQERLPNWPARSPTRL